MIILSTGASAHGPPQCRGCYLRWCARCSAAGISGVVGGSVLRESWNEHEAKTERDRSQIAVYFSRESEKSMPKQSKICRKGGMGTPVGPDKHENV